MPDNWRRILLPRLGREPAAEMDAEIAAHVQLYTDELIRNGMSRNAASRRAEERFRDLCNAREELHAAARRREAQLRHHDWCDALIGDIRFGWRQIGRNRTHAAFAIATLALGIGLTTAVFTLVERTLLRPLPLRDSTRLVALQGRDSLQRTITTVSVDDWLDWRDGSRTLAGVTAYAGPERMAAVTADSSAHLRVLAASGQFFQVVGSRLLLGRGFTESEAQDRAHVAVVSEGVWRDFLGSDSTLVKALPIGTSSYRVIGVVASGSGYPEGTDAWVPMAVVRDAGGAMRNNINYHAIARLKPGVTPAQATADLQRVSRGIRARDRGGLYDYGVEIEPLQSVVVGSGVAASLRLLALAVVGVLALVCANLTIATLARGGVRQSEMAIRTSLGATRRRLLMQLLVEHLVLAALGAVGGVIVAWMTVRALLALWSDSIPRATEVRLDGVVLGFAVGIALVAGVVAGLIPALRGSRVSLDQMMKEGGRTSVRGRPLAASILVGAEFALAVVLLTGAGLLIHSFRVLVARDLGFDRRLATVALALPSTDSTARLATWDQMIASYRAIPGVRRVGIANWIPLSFAGKGFIDVEGNDDPRAGAGYRIVSEDYLSTLGLRLTQGRSIGTEDIAGSPHVVVINQAMASKFWSGQNPIGRRVRARSMEAGPDGDQDAPWLTVIGVVSDLRQWGFESIAEPEMYVSFRQAPQWRTTNMIAVVASDLPPAQLLPALRRATRAVDSHLAPDLSTLELQLSGFLAPRRLTMSLLAIFAALALALAAIGIYAVLSYAVLQRTRELALRAALGAPRHRLLTLIVRSGMSTVVAGSLVGVAGAIAASQLLTSMLVDIHAIDPVAIVGSLALLGLVALGAILIPAIRAMRLDPMAALRGE